MFTGLIQEVGRIRSIRARGEGAQLEVEAEEIGPRAELGESIAVNGTCLTVEGSRPWGFVCYAGGETLDRTTIGLLKIGSPVNLERALRVGDRLGGHFVQGHVDCVGELVERKEEGGTVRLRFDLPEEYARYVVEKGSVAVDGISLTVTETAGTAFGVAIIPHTLAHTTLEAAERGQRVNIETDILAKYVERLQGGETDEGVSKELLTRHGFISESGRA